MAQIRVPPSGFFIKGNAPGDVLVWNGSEWIPQPGAGGVTPSLGAVMTSGTPPPANSASGLELLGLGAPLQPDSAARLQDVNADNAWLEAIIFTGDGNTPAPSPQTGLLSTGVVGAGGLGWSGAAFTIPDPTATYLVSYSLEFLFAAPGQTIEVNGLGIANSQGKVGPIVAPGSGLQFSYSFAIQSIGNFIPDFASDGDFVLRNSILRILRQTTNRTPNTPIP